MRCFGAGRKLQLSDAHHPNQTQARLVNGRASREAPKTVCQEQGNLNQSMSCNNMHMFSRRRVNGLRRSLQLSICLMAVDGIKQLQHAVDIASMLSAINKFAIARHAPCRSAYCVHQSHTISHLRSHICIEHLTCYLLVVPGIGIRT